MTDRYTRAVLTVIAACLLYLCFHTTLSIPDARAAVQSTKAPIDVNLVRIDGKEFGIYTTGEHDPALPVRVVDK